jgi:hypothetical protein
VNQKTNWLRNPTKTQFIVVLALYFVSLILIVAVMTEIFEKAPAFRENYMPLVVLTFATIAIAKISTNYFKKTK